MKISKSDAAKLFLSSKIERFKKKIADGDITFDDCGLDVKKNFLQSSELVLIGKDNELEQYCENLCAECPHSRCAVFLIYNDHRVSCVVKMGYNDFDVFRLDESWHCWNFISIEDNFELTAYGILCETRSGEWKTITR